MSPNVGNLIKNVIIHSKNLVRFVVNEASKHFNRFKQTVVSLEEN
jgi:hypothetical protein